MNVESAAVAWRAGMPGWALRARCAAWLAFGAAWAVIDRPAVAGAERAPAPPTTLGSIVSELDADSIEVRDRAAVRLASLLETAMLTGAMPVVAELEGALVEQIRAGSLSLEQRERVLEAIRGRFMRSPRGAIGVSFDFTVAGPRGGLPIQALVGGFPAGGRGVLRVGDVIMAVRGVRVGVQGSGLPLVQPQVASHEPGDLVAMSIIRPDETPGAAPAVPGAPRAELITEGERKNATALEVLVPLGSYSDLGGAGFLSRAVLEAAWVAWLERNGIGEGCGPGVEFGLTASDWNRKNGAVENVINDLRIAGVTQAGARDEGIRAGGMTLAEAELQQQLLRAEVRLAPELLPGGRKNPAQNAALRNQLRVVELQNREAEVLNQIFVRIQALNRQIDALTSARQNAKTPEEKATIGAEIEQLRLQVNRLVGSIPRPRQPPARP